MPVSMCEEWVVGQNCTQEKLDRLISETPPHFRFESTELSEKGIPNLRRIRPECWPQANNG